MQSKIGIQPVFLQLRNRGGRKDAVVLKLLGTPGNHKELRMGVCKPSMSLEWGVGVGLLQVPKTSVSK